MNVYDEIKAERDYQDGRWGHRADDELNRPNDWSSYIAHHSTRWFSGGFPPYSASTVDSFRKQMIKVAALAVAAVESIDRQRAENGRPFYQQQ